MAAPVSVPAADAARASAERRVRQARRYLATGGTGMLAGIAIAATGHGLAGGLVSLAAASVLVGGIHAFGRAGPEQG